MTSYFVGAHQNIGRKRTHDNKVSVPPQGKINRVRKINLTIGVPGFKVLV